MRAQIEIEEGKAMPRVHLKKKEYVAKDLCACIIGKMHMQGMLQKDMGDLLGITQQAFGRKLRKCQFSYLELLEVFKKLDFSDEEILRYSKI